MSTGPNLLDYFAAEALSGMLSHCGIPLAGEEGNTAENAYRVAWAMVKEHEKHAPLFNPRRSPAPKDREVFEPRECEHCGKSYSPRRADQKFCTGTCSMLFNRDLACAEPATCKGCGKEFKKKVPVQLYCTPRCRVLSQLPEEHPST